MTKIAIIGAGLAGLTAASRLKNLAAVTIFEKARGVGGRMTTRRAEPFYFDHGAQFFKAKTSEFRAFIEPLIKLGIIQSWDARFVEFNQKTKVSQRVWDHNYPHYVATPGMNAVAKYLANDLKIKLTTKVTRIDRQQNGWNLFDENAIHLGSYDWVISTAPAEQTASLLPPSFKFHEIIQNIQMLGCFALMLGFTEPLALDFDAALVRNADISWISVNSSKPGRSGLFSLVVHSTNKWAQEHIEQDNQSTIAHLSNQVSEIINYDVSNASHIALHRWRYANIPKQSGLPIMIDNDLKLAACGDWTVQGRVESAFTSANKLVDSILKFL